MQSIDVNRNRIKRARELRGWSQGDVAEKLGCDARSVGRWERGVVSPSTYYRQKLCQLFEQNMEELGFLEEDIKDVQPVSQGQEVLQVQAEQNVEEPELINDAQRPVSLESEALQVQPQWKKETVQMSSPMGRDPFLQQRSDKVQGVSILRRIPMRMFIELFLLLLLILGSISIFTSVHLVYSPKNSVSTVPVRIAPTSTATAKATSVSTIPYGKLLYRAMAPGSKCDFGGGQWIDYNQPDIQCLATQAVISNPSVTAPDLRGTILASIPGIVYPENYVLEAQVQQPTTAADFGLYFRNQPGDQQGIYTFSIHPNGAWGAYVYDNITGVQTLIASGTAFIDPHAQLYLTVVAVGPNFTFYVNRQKVGGVRNVTYGAGTVGIAVDAGGTIVVNDVSLYSVV